VGIDAAELPHIFERFYRGSRANEARAAVASAAEGSERIAAAVPPDSDASQDGERNVTETSSSDSPQVNPASAP
jgi:hypothetical protein